MASKTLQIKHVKRRKYLKCSVNLLNKYLHGQLAVCPEFSLNAFAAELLCLMLQKIKFINKQSNRKHLWCCWRHSVYCREQTWPEVVDCDPSGPCLVESSPSQCRLLLPHGRSLLVYQLLFQGKEGGFSYQAGNRAVDFVPSKLAASH